MSDRLDEKRQDELTTILRRKMYTVFIDVATYALRSCLSHNAETHNALCSESLAPITMIITFVTYVSLWHGQNLAVLLTLSVDRPWP